MLPVVRGERETTRQIVLYTVVLVAFTLVGRLLARAGLHRRRGACSAASSSGSPWQLRREPTRRRAASSSTTRSLYLALLFVAAAVDPVLL